jgi:hypothetical protein
MESLFYPEDGGNIYLQISIGCPTVYMASLFYPEDGSSIFLQIFSDCPPVYMPSLFCIFLQIFSDCPTCHHSSILKTEAAFFSRKLVPMNQGTLCHIPEARNPICGTRLYSPYVVTLLSYRSS